MKEKGYNGKDNCNKSTSTFELMKVIEELEGIIKCRISDTSNKIINMKISTRFVFCQMA